MKDDQEYVNVNTKLTFTCDREHEWLALPKDVLKGSKCPTCSKKPFSKKAIDWLNSISQRENIIIQHAENGGEFLVPGTNFKADGYCKETNTLYEFYGDAFHGNPDVFSPHARCHPYSKKLTARYLYNTTKQRALKLRELGYNVVEMWESDFEC